jgi:chromate reductase
MTQMNVLGICGALRADSSNLKLLKEAIRVLDPASSEIADLRLPLFDEDIEIEQGTPAEVQRLADQIAAADAVIISTPEYNKGVTGVLKNALDWVSRTDGNPWLNKPVAVMSAAQGRAGGERSQQMLRWCMNPFRPRVLPGPELMLAASRSQFDESGMLTNELSLKTLTTLMTELKAEVDRAV